MFYVTLVVVFTFLCVCVIAGTRSSNRAGRRRRQRFGVKLNVLSDMSGGLHLTVTKCRAFGFILVFIGSIMTVGLSVYFLAVRPNYPAANSCSSPKRPLSQSNFLGGLWSNKSVLVENVIRLPRTVLPRHYDVRLWPILEKGNSTVLGRVAIDVQCLQSTDRIVLHSSDINVDLKSVQVLYKYN